MKKLAAIITAIVLILSLAACAAPTEPSPSETVVPSEKPSAAPSAAPSIAPSAEPSATPDCIDAYWQGRTLTSSSGDLMIDAARWVSDYYDSFDDISSVDLAAARIYELRDDGFSLYTECYFYKSKSSGAIFDEYSLSINDYWARRTASFDFEVANGGYRYVGTTAPTAGTLEYTMKTTVMENGAEVVGVENDIWLLETLVGAIANSDPNYDLGGELPKDAEYIGSLEYSYAGRSSSWDFYKYLYIVDEFNSYYRIAAKHGATGEVFDIGSMYAGDTLFVRKPTPQELRDEIASVLNDPIFVGTRWCNFYCSADDCAALNKLFESLQSPDQIRFYSYDRDNTIDYPEEISFRTLDGKYLYMEYQMGGIRLSISTGDSYMELWISNIPGVKEETDRILDRKVETIRDGRFLTDYDEKFWKIDSEVPELKLLRVANDLYDPFDFSNSEFVNAELDESTAIEYNGRTYYDFTPLYDPDSDGWYAHISSYAEFEEYVYTIFAKDFANSALQKGNHMSAPAFIKGPNGEVYSYFSGRGGGNPWVENPLAAYAFEPREGMLVVREIYEHCEPAPGTKVDEYDFVVVGEGAWDHIFLWEEGRWKFAATARIV